MRLRIIAIKGHFNLCDTSQETVSVHMDLPDGKYINIDFPVNDNSVDWIDDPHTWTDTAVQLIDKWNKRVWISTAREEVKAFKAFILEHQKEIDLARLKEVLEEKRTKMLKLNEQLGELEKDILDLMITEIPVLPL